MQESDVAGLLREGMLVTLYVGGPPLLAALAVGMIVSLFQAATQINEQTLAFVPKVAVIGLTLMVLGSFMMATLSSFTLTLFDRLVAVGGQ
ncbi:MAG: flagellar biosynthesis protein FliQ [Alphaproteobacteria bacterium]|jgi:flagellar biosynthetic protein FliQ|nr:flagellar biosynthesis protein FliQ [Alphaproteobacteria bacterium]